MSFSLAQWLLLISCAGFALFIGNIQRVRRSMLPPGPPALPLIGNVLDFPTSHYGPRFSQMAEKYGNMIYLDLLGQPVVVVHSYDAAVDLMDRRSVNYSGRPRSIMAQLTDYDEWVFVLMQYGQKWRQHRRIVAQSFHPDTLNSAKPLLTAITHELLCALRDTPNRFSQHIGFALAKSTMRLVYGLELTDPDDKFFHMATTIVGVGSAMAVPGAFLVDTVPILRHVPMWFPGAQFRKIADTWKLQTRSYRDQLFDAGKAVVDHGVLDSLVGRVVGTADEPSLAEELDDNTDDACRGAAAAAYAGGADTTHATTHVFFLAMAIHKDVQEKAQAELDSVVGPDRLPTFADRDSLPYTNALMKEVLRWHVISPIGVAHRSDAEDVYKGYSIPAGALIIPNVWAMARDESEYPEPDEFRPGRFLRDGKIDPNVRDPASFAFGFGRRICPGLHFVDIALYITFASILHVFRIGPPVDEDGAPQPLKARYVETSLTARPQAFECTITPRSAHAVRLINALSEDAKGGC
ncbi:cytochrome P450 [Trametes gibbosa]|nr:cytochrome P450 [Trametes gibbosa]